MKLTPDLQFLTGQDLHCFGYGEHRMRRFTQAPMHIIFHCLRFMEGGRLSDVARYRTPQPYKRNAEVRSKSNRSG